MLLLALLAPVQAAELEPYVMGQVWTTLYDQDQSAQADSAGYGDPEDDPGFKLRRARLGMTRAPELGASPQERIGFSIILGMSSGADPIIAINPGEIGLIDAHMSFAATENLTLSTGLVKVPWGRENQFSSLQLPFQERSIQSNHMVSLREVGAVAIWEGPKGIRLSGGAFNGNGSLTGDTDPLLLFAGRAEWATKGQHRRALRTFGTVDSPVIGIAADVAYNNQAATDQLVLGGDVIVRVQGLALIAEGHWSQITPLGGVEAPGVLSQTTRFGAYAQAGYSLGERWEPVVRWEIWDEDTARQDNGDLMHVYAGVTSHLLEDSLRIGGGYVLRSERGGSSVPNDTARLWLQYIY
jgi:hypothetical protein